MSSRRIEKIKLSATYLNGIAVAVFAVGGFAPLFTAGRPHPGDGEAFLTFVGLTVGCWIASAGIHYFARSILDRLPDE